VQVRARRRDAPEELEKLAGYDATSRRLGPRRADCCGGRGADGPLLHLHEPRGPDAYEPVGIWLIDQWRQIGLNATMATIEAPARDGAPGRNFTVVQ